jgi:hypothetical protein
MINDTGLVHIHPAELLVSDPSFSEAEIAIENLKEA